MSFAKRLQVLAEQLKVVPQVGKVEIALNDPAAEINFTVFKVDYHYDLSDEIRDVYRQLDGARLYWTYRSNNITSIGGEFELFPFIMVVGSTGEGHIWYKGLEDEGWGAKKFKTLARRMRPFDSYETAYDGTRFAAFEVRKGVAHPPIWFWRTDGDKFPLALTFPEYLDRMLQARAFLNWQYFFIDLDRLDFGDRFATTWLYSASSEALTAMERFLHTMPLLFPEDDYDDYRARYAALKEAFEEVV